MAKIRSTKKHTLKKKAAKPKRVPKKRTKVRVAPPKPQQPLNITINSQGGAGQGGNSQGAAGSTSFEHSTAGQQYEQKNNELYAKIHDLQTSFEKHANKIPEPFIPKTNTPLEKSAPQPKKETSLSSGKSKLDFDPSPKSFSTANVSSMSIPSSFKENRIPNLTTQSAARVGVSNLMPEVERFIALPAPTQEDMQPPPAFEQPPVLTLTDIARDQSLVPYIAPFSTVRPRKRENRVVSAQHDAKHTGEDFRNAGTLIRKQVLHNRKKEKEKSVVRDRVSQIEQSIQESQKQLRRIDRRKRNNENALVLHENDDEPVDVLPKLGKRYINNQPKK